MIDEARFMYMAELLKIFIKENKRVPKQLEVYRGEKVGRWLANQKVLYCIGKLSKNREKILKSINSEILINQKVINGRHFKYMLSLLHDFILSEGRLPKTNEEYSDEKLGKWLSNQKTFYKMGKLYNERKEALEAIDSRIFITKQDLEVEHYVDMSNLLKEFIKEKGRIPRSKEEYKDQKIGAWLSNQKHLYKVRRLKAKKKDILENIDYKVYTYINS